MTEEEAMFDTSMKKKKKKKKTPFDLDAVMAEGSGTAAPEEPASGTAAPDAASNAAPEPSAPEPDDDDFSSMKKKKKKKKVIDMSELEEALPASEEKGGEDAAPAGDDLGEEDLDFTLPSKKKKKKKVKLEDKMLDDAEAADEANKSKSNGQAWSDTDRDYTYDELLKRVFDIMRVKKPEMVAGEKKKFVLKPPQVMRVGTKKTSFANFADICRMLHRQPDHLLAFLLAELGTSGSVDGNNQLIIKGRFLQKQIENVLRSYIREYVTCQTCKSPDTILQKDTRLFFVQCETCGSRCSVASIKSGFQAVTGRRAAMRARQT